MSTIRFVSFKGIPWGRRQHSLIIVAVGLLVWSVVVYSEIVLLLIAAGLYCRGGHDTRRSPCSSSPSFAYCLSDAPSRALAASGHCRSHIATRKRFEILA